MEFLRTTRGYVLRYRPATRQTRSYGIENSCDQMSKGFAYPRVLPGNGHTLVVTTKTHVVSIAVTDLDRLLFGYWNRNSPSRRVSTTLRQVFAKFSEFFMCWGFPRKNFAPGSPGSDDLQLGRPTVFPLLSFFKRISHFQSSSLRSAVPEQAC